MLIHGKSLLDKFLRHACNNMHVINFICNTTSSYADTGERLLYACSAS